MLLHKNKKAYFDYEIIKNFTAGIILSGGEVRSCRLGNINLKGAFITISDGKFLLRGAHISKFAYDTSATFLPERVRELLLTTKEREKILMELHTPGITLIPLELITEGRLIKLSIALCRGKKQYDKREVIKKRDVDRKEMRQIKARY